MRTISRFTGLPFPSRLSKLVTRRNSDNTNYRRSAQALPRGKLSSLETSRGSLDDGGNSVDLGVDAYHHHASPRGVLVCFILPTSDTEEVISAWYSGKSLQRHRAMVRRNLHYNSRRFPVFELSFLKDKRRYKVKFQDIISFPTMPPVMVVSNPKPSQWRHVLVSNVISSTAAASTFWNNSCR